MYQKTQRLYRLFFLRRYREQFGLIVKFELLNFS